MMIKVYCETCDWNGRRRDTTRTPCPKCGGMDVWHLNKDGQWIGRAGPVEATPLWEVNDLGGLRVYRLLNMVAFASESKGYMINKEEAAALAKALADFANS